MNVSDGRRPTSSTSGSIEELRKALGPFARYALHVAAKHPGWDHDDFVVPLPGNGTLLFAHFRRAAALASKSPPAQEGFAPCPTCHQYSHTIGEDRIAAALIHFESMYADPVRGHPMGHHFDEATRDAAQVLIAAAKAKSPPPTGDVRAIDHLGRLLMALYARPDVTRLFGPHEEAIYEDARQVVNRASAQLPPPIKGPERFDIRDGHNRYRPCPECKADHGMGLVDRGTALAVQCSCGHRGPEVEGTDLPWHERDRLAFEAWNAASPPPIKGEGLAFCGHERMDKEGLARWRESSREGNGHDIAGANNNTVRRLVATIDYLAERLATPSSPEGWVLVPREPTEEMMDAGGFALAKERLNPQPVDSLAIKVWEAMLAAAPSSTLIEGVKP